MQTKFEPMGTNRNPDKRLSRGWMIPAPVKVSTQSKHGDGKQYVHSSGWIPAEKAQLGLRDFERLRADLQRYQLCSYCVSGGKISTQLKAWIIQKVKEELTFHCSMISWLTDCSIGQIGLQWGYSCWFIWWWRCLLSCWGRWLVSLV